MQKRIRKTKQRYEALYKAYLFVLQVNKDTNKSLRELYEEATLQPAPEFYLNPKVSGEIIRAKLKEGKNRKYRDTIKDQRDEDLLNAYFSVIEKHGSMAVELSKNFLYKEAALSPAPRFYVTPEQASRIISNMLKEDV